MPYFKNLMMIYVSKLAVIYVKMITYMINDKS